VELVFLKLPSVRFALARVKSRVALGGHHVPASVVRRRYHAGWRNFQQLYRPLVDHWELYDNTGAAPILIDQRDNP
jgi:predicted ABC-type ATPase